MPYGVASPLEQNRKHIIVLKDVLASSLVTLPSRLGLTMRPTLESVVLVSKGAAITRPKGKIDGLDRVIKNDQLRTFIDRAIDGESAATSLTSIAKFVSGETVEQLARQLVALHRPIQFDWHARFGLKPRLDGPGRDSNQQPPQPLQPPTQQQASLKPPSHAPSPPPAAARGVTGEDGGDIHEGRLSTSKFAAAKGWKTADALTRLSAAGYLVVEGDQHRLTDRGYQAGGRFVEKSRYGPYFLWPKDLSLDASAAS